MGSDWVADCGHPLADPCEGRPLASELPQNDPWLENGFNLWFVAAIIEWISFPVVAALSG